MDLPPNATGLVSYLARSDADREPVEPPTADSGVRGPLELRTRAVGYEPVDLDVDTLVGEGEVELGHACSAIPDEMVDDDGQSLSSEDLRHRLLPTAVDAFGSQHPLGPGPAEQARWRIVRSGLVTGMPLGDTTRSRSPHSDVR